MDDTVSPCAVCESMKVAIGVSLIQRPARGRCALRFMPRAGSKAGAGGRSDFRLTGERA